LKTEISKGFNLKLLWAKAAELPKQNCFAGLILGLKCRFHKFCKMPKKCAAVLNATHSSMPFPSFNLGALDLSFCGLGG
jgi:hypothetical protein